MIAGPFQPEINSFRLHLNAEGKSTKTVRTYVEAAAWFAVAHLRANTDWADVEPDDVRAWLIHLLNRYSDSSRTTSTGPCSSSSSGTRRRSFPTRWCE